MTLIFSICSIFYAVFYLILSFLNTNVDYVDNILSINLKSINTAIENVNKGGHQLTYEDYMFNVQ